VVAVENGAELEGGLLGGGGCGGGSDSRCIRDLRPL